MQLPLKTPRLLLRPLHENDAAFILELVNSPGWLEFIGDRNVHTIDDATNYIQNILTSAQLSYTVFEDKETRSALGILTYIQRPYLNAPDFGFAMLPEYSGLGYAREAAQAFLNHLSEQDPHTPLLAITLPDNIRSIRLLEHLGFTYQEVLETEEETRYIYKLSKT
ncbi:GNAT family N-acetyltransferase [Croceiramulus getboli]|nr:GNAT family N-acetyltransferase [Flavobacteriaceae bacterium YJPT1-3]